ncbi:MAG: response regulator transcription factor [Lachnospiraceae bacterium]|nr:response regulator transcription factor [Lachnospiraceae bacterium]MCI9096413.1 response regulator transcription factor [Lachnospiraceae bacterium]MCI9203798.1 response regulator transcription factor [Lachnospiraceae bacterium]MCI9334353.1 response regulator transcription factor [Lachnospiraceae bacterium]
MNYKIAICDDSTADQNYIKDMTRCWAAEGRYVLHIDTFVSAESFLFHYAEHKDYDILLLDIEMEGMDGISLAKKLRQENDQVQIVFVTGFPDFMAQGYEVSALHYLLKPLEEETLCRVLDRAAANLKKADRSVIFTVDGEALRLDVREIMSAEALAHFCRINTLRGQFEVRQNFSELAEKLGEGFIRTHRSYLVQVACIRRISKTEVILDNWEKVPLSRSNYHAVNQAFIRHFEGEWK